MSDMPLSGYRILIVEDEYLLAIEMKSELHDEGAHVIGPVGRLDRALALVGSCEAIDGAILDVNLRGEMAYPLADLLAKRGIPFVFTTGYEVSAVPSRFAGVALCLKPTSTWKVGKAILQAMVTS